jgi:hypothetical protein
MADANRIARRVRAMSGVVSAMRCERRYVRAEAQAQCQSETDSTMLLLTRCN